MVAVLGSGDLLDEFEVIQGLPHRAAGNVAVLPLECRVIPGRQIVVAPPDGLQHYASGTTAL